MVHMCMCVYIMDFLKEYVKFGIKSTDILHISSRSTLDQLIQDSAGISSKQDLVAKTLGYKYSSTVGSMK